MILETREGALRLPTASILAGDKVLVVEGEELVERRIERGLSNWDFTEVVSGLVEGERVVAAIDKPEIKAGARVEVEAADAP